MISLHVSPFFTSILLLPQAAIPLFYYFFLFVYVFLQTAFPVPVFLKYI